MPTDLSPEAVVAVGACGRIVAAVTVGTLPILPGTSPRIRLALAASLALVAVPIAVAAPAGGRTPAVVPLVAGELLVGLALGTAAACTLAASAWAGGILGSVSGLAWADDFDPVADGQSAGVTRLAWWVGLAAFFRAGGLLAVVGGLVDGLRLLPVGTVFAGGPAAWLEALVVTAPAAALALAALLAMPALVAVIAFHLASAICLRAVPFAPGPGLLQGLASLVLLAGLWLGAEAWAEGGAMLMVRSVEACFAGR